MESLGFFIIYLGWVLVYSTQLLVLYARYPQAWRWAWQTAKVHKRKTRRKKGRLKPRSPEDCAACRQKIKLKVFRARTDVVPCEATKKKVGRPKTIATEGDGKRGKRQHIQHFKCQACQARFTSRLHPPLYWLRTDEDTVVAVLWLLVEGAPLAVLARFTGHQEATLTRWLERMGIHREKLHNRLFRNLVLKFVQMDELFARVRREGVKWVWFALDPLTKIIPAMHVGDRSNDDAMHLVHDLKSRLRTQGVPPLFTTDGLRSYFYALTAHFGYWHKPARARKLHWAVSTLLTYGQLVKRKTKQVYTETRMLWGQKETLVSQLQAAGYSGQI